jgi:WD40 repeat protein/ankyrin repeat protein
MSALTYFVSSHPFFVLSCRLASLVWSASHLISLPTLGNKAIAQNLSTVISSLISHIDRWSSHDTSTSRIGPTSMSNADVAAPTAAAAVVLGAAGRSHAFTQDDSVAENQVEYASNFESKVLGMDDALSGVFEQLSIESDILKLLTGSAIDSTLKHLQAPVASMANAASSALSSTDTIGTVLSNVAAISCRTVVQGLMNVAACVPLFGKLFQLGLAVFRQADEYEEMQRVFEKLCKSMYSGLRLLQLLTAAASTSKSQSGILQTFRTFRPALVRLLDILALIERIEDASTFRNFIQSSDMRKDIVDMSSAFRSDVQDVLIQSQTGVLDRLISVEHRTDAVEQQVEQHAEKLSTFVSSTDKKLASKASTKALSLLQHQVQQQRKHLRGFAVASALSSTNAHHCWQQVVRSMIRAATHGGVLGIPSETIVRMRVHVPLKVTVTDRDTAEQFDADILFQRASAGCTTRNTLFADADDKYLRNSSADVRVFLLQGRAGSGKTHTGWHVWHQAALQCDERAIMDCKSPPTDCLVPLFISLNHFRDAALNGTLMQEYFGYFEGLGAMPDVAVESLRTYGRFLIILDGLDELADKETHIYMKNELHRWTNSVVCISSRTGFLSSVDRGIETLIAPVSIMSNVPQMAQVQQLHIRPFNDSQRSEYIRKYCSAAFAHGKAMADTDLDEVVLEYETHLAQLHDIQSLASKPLTLFMLLDVLPHMHQNLGHLRTTSSMTPLSSAPIYLRTSSSVDADVTVLEREVQEKPLRLDTDKLELSRSSTHVFPRLRQVELYAVFLRHWLQRETDRLVNAGQLKRQNQLAVIGEAEDFCAKLAFEMFLHDCTSIQWCGSDTTSQSDSKTHILSRRERHRLKQQSSPASTVPNSIMQLLTEAKQQHDGSAFAASPLVRSGTSYSFLHKSIREYLAAYHVCSQIMDACLDDGDNCMAWSDRLQRVDAIAELMLSKRCLTADYAVLSFAGELVDQRYSLSHPYRASWPVVSWIDFCDSKSEFGSLHTAPRHVPPNRQPLLKALFDIIEASKHMCGDGYGCGDDCGVPVSTVRTAAANAISILNAANVSFSGMNFSGIQIGRIAGAGTRLAYPAADLSGALLYGADVSGANLSHVRLECAALNDCKLTGSVLDHALFGQRPKISPGHTADVFDVVYDRVRGWLITASADSTICVTQISSGDCVAVLEGHTRGVHGLSYDADSGILASASIDGTVRIWDVVQVNCANVLQHNSSVYCVSFDASTNTVVSGSLDGTVRVFDSVSGKCRHVMQSPESSAIWCVCYDTSGNAIFSGNDKGKILIWKLDAASSNAGIVSRDRAVSAAESDPISFDAHSSSRIRAIAFDPDNLFLLAACDNGSVHIWDVSNGFDNIDQPLRSCIGHLDWCRSMSYDPTSHRLATASRDGTVRLFDTLSGVCLSSIHTGSNVTRAVWFDATSNVVYAAVVQHVQVWDLSVSDRLSKTSRTSSSPVSALFLDDQSWSVASGDLDGCVHVWDLHSGQLTLSFTNHDSAVSAVCIGLHSRYVVSASCDGTICIRDLHEHDTEDRVLVPIPDTSCGDEPKQDWADTLHFDQLVTSDHCTSSTVFASTINGAMLQWDLENCCWTDRESARRSDGTLSTASEACGDYDKVFPAAAHSGTFSVHAHGHGVKVLRHDSGSYGTVHNEQCIWSSDPYMLSHNGSEVLSNVVDEAEFHVTDWNSALWSACDQNLSSRVAFLTRQAGCDPNHAGNDGRTPLYIASQNGHLDVVRYLVDKAKCDPNQASSDGTTPVNVASAKGHLATVHYLVAEANCDANQANNSGWTPVITASYDGHLDIVHYLVADAQCDPKQADKDGTTPVYVASQNGHLDTVRYLVGEAGCDANQADNNGWTPVNVASQIGHLDTVRYLVAEAKCDPNQANNNGTTPLIMASQQGHLKIVRYLVAEAKCDPNQANNNGTTALYIASYTGHLDIVRCLVAEGKCDPNQAVNDGTTPVYIACQEGHLDIVHYLVGEGKCDALQRSNGGTATIDIANQNGHIGIVKYLSEQCNMQCGPMHAHSDDANARSSAESAHHIPESDADEIQKSSDNLVAHDDPGKCCIIL